MSGLMAAADWAAMAADLAAVRGDNEASIAIRRGSTTLAAQAVRIARIGQRSAAPVGQNASEVQQGVVALGGLSFDVQVGDRFTVAGVLYEVTTVRPNRRAAVVAEAKAIL